MPHHYKLGEHVGLAFGFHDQEAGGLYEITALLPTRIDGEPQYRIKGSDDRERVIGEGQILELGKPQRAARHPHGAHNPITIELNRLRDEAITSNEEDETRRDRET